MLLAENNNLYAAYYLIISSSLCSWLLPRSERVWSQQYLLSSWYLLGHFAQSSSRSFNPPLEQTDDTGARFPNLCKVFVQELPPVLVFPSAVLNSALPSYRSQNRKIQYLLFYFYWTFCSCGYRENKSPQTEPQSLCKTICNGVLPGGCPSGCSWFTFFTLYNAASCMSSLHLGLSVQSPDSRSVEDPSVG